MNYLKLLGRAFLYILGIFIIGTFLLTSLHYIGVFGPKLVTFFQILIPVMALFIGGMIVGKHSLKKGWLEGIKLGLIVLVLLFLFGYLGLQYRYELRSILFGIILLFSSAFGGMFGINKKSNPE